MRSIKRDELLLRIARFLMLHGSFINNLGLINGKMGIIIFFFHLSRYTGKKIFEDFAGEMIDEVYKEIHNHYPANFENGLSGIAWGMEYLIQNQFVEADSNEVLEDLDNMIFEWDIRKVNDYSLETGLEGIARYVISRCMGKPVQNIIIPQNYILDLIAALEKNPTKKSEVPNILISILRGEHSEVKDNLLTDMVSKIKFQSANLFIDSKPLGVGKNGYAGIGLNLILNS